MLTASLVAVDERRSVQARIGDIGGQNRPNKTNSTRPFGTRCSLQTNIPTMYAGPDIKRYEVRSTLASSTVITDRAVEI